MISDVFVPKFNGITVEDIRFQQNGTSLLNLFIPFPKCNANASVRNLQFDVCVVSYIAYKYVSNNHFIHSNTAHVEAPHRTKLIDAYG